MAITIRNSETERMIREIGKRYGEGPSQTIRRLAEKELDQPGAASQEEFDRRMRAWDELTALAPPRDPDLTWKDIEREMDSLFDYLDEDEDEES